MKMRVVIALNFVLLVLVIGIAVQCFAYGRDITAVSQKEDENAVTAYPLDRDAVVCASESLLFCNAVGGSGNETLIDAFCVNEYIYLFGNSDKCDGDLVALSSCSFMAKLSLDLKILGVFSIPDGLTSVSLCEGGFLCVSNGEKSTVLTVYSFEGEKLRSRELITQGATDTPKLFSTDNFFTIVHTVKTSKTGKNQLLVRQFNSDLNLINEQSVSSQYSLSPLNCYYLNGETHLFCKAESDLVKCVLYTKINGSSVSLFYADENSFYSCFDVLPHEKGWAIVFTDESKSGVFLCDFEGKTLDTLAVSSPSKYACVKFMGSSFYLLLNFEEKSELYACDIAFSNARKLDFSCSQLLSSIITNESAICLCSLPYGLSAQGVDDSLSLSIAGSFSGGKLISHGDSYYLVSTSLKKEGDVAFFLGNSDIFLAKLNV